MFQLTSASGNSHLTNTGLLLLVSEICVYDYGENRKDFIEKYKLSNCFRLKNSQGIVSLIIALCWLGLYSVKTFTWSLPPSVFPPQGSGSCDLHSPYLGPT